LGQQRLEGEDADVLFDLCQEALQQLKFTDTQIPEGVQWKCAAAAMASQSVKTTRHRKDCTLWKQAVHDRQQHHPGQCESSICDGQTRARFYKEWEDKHAANANARSLKWMLNGGPVMILADSP